MNITNQFEVECLKCLDSGEYYDGKKMVTCDCGSGKKLKKENDDKGKVSEETKPTSG